MTAIWQAVVDRVLPEVPVGTEALAFVDLADPEKRKTAELAAPRLLTSFRTHFRTVLGLNRKEATEVSKALGLNLSVPAAEPTWPNCCRPWRKVCGSTVVVHPVDRAAAVFGTEFTSVPGPYTSRPFPRPVRATASTPVFARIGIKPFSHGRFDAWHRTSGFTLPRPQPLVG